MNIRHALKPGLRWILALACSLSIPSAISAQQSAHTPLTALIDRTWRYTMSAFPEWATYNGYTAWDTEWTDYSPRGFVERRARFSDALARLHEIDRNQLTDQDYLNYDVFEDFLATVAGVPAHDRALPGFHYGYTALSQMEGVHLNIPQILSLMPHATVRDYENIITRLASVPELIDGAIATLEADRKAGVTLPRVILRNVPGQLDALMVENPRDAAMMAAFAAFPDRIPEKEQQRLTEDANEAYRALVIPAFTKLRDYVTGTYIPSARSTIAMTDLPGGDEWYRYKVRVFTTTDLTPQQIHELGLREVKRIRARMDSVILESGFDGTFEEFVRFLKTDERFYYTSKEDLLAGYRDIAKRADPELIKLFGRLPGLPYGVTAVPAYSERSQTAAYYQPGSLTAGRPGYFYANTYDLPSRPKWEMEALTLHEAVPGHHLQFALTLEMDGVPEFRKYVLYNAYTEGWGLYAETLGYDMGFYDNPYSRFGQLTFQMWRAVRLVVDTGIHALGWSRQEAIDYFEEQSGRPEHDVVVEVDRYIAWPGQALGYMIGKLQIEGLRDMARRRLGDRFDIRRFHDQLLINGGLPLNILEAQIDAWVNEQLP